MAWQRNVALGIVALAYAYTGVYAAMLGYYAGLLGQIFGFSPTSSWFTLGSATYSTAAVVSAGSLGWAAVSKTRVSRIAFWGPLVLWAVCCSGLVVATAAEQVQPQPQPDDWLVVIFLLMGMVTVVLMCFAVCCV